MALPQWPKLGASQTRSQGLCWSHQAPPRSVFTWFLKIFQLKSFVLCNEWQILNFKLLPLELLISIISKKQLVQISNLSLYFAVHAHHTQYSNWSQICFKLSKSAPVKVLDVWGHQAVVFLVEGVPSQWFDLELHLRFDRTHPPTRP